MKALGFIFAAALLMLAYSANAQDVRKVLDEKKYNEGIENLLMALESDNLGLQRSAIYLLGRFKSDRAVILLVKILHNSADEKSRIAAAYSLCKIGGGVASQAVMEAVRFDASKKVRLQSAWYYNLFVKEGTFAFVPTTEKDVIAESVK
jgi:HEAT repeat protein